MPVAPAPSLVDTRRDAGDEAVRARLLAALAAHPERTRAEHATALGCSRQWLEREAAAVGVVLPAGKPGPRGPRRPSAEAPK